MHFLDADERVKIKYAEYVRLHRIVTGLNARTVWEVLVTGGDLDELTEPLPDEFHAWVRGVAAELTAQVDGARPRGRGGVRRDRRRRCRPAGGARSSRSRRCRSPQRGACSCGSTARTTVPPCGSRHARPAT